MTGRPAECWCKNTELVPFGAGYLRCPSCETLVDTTASADGAGDAGFYGREYFFSHQEQARGYPNIVVRARTDFLDRCLAWLRTVLKYRLPPARILEVGAAHGAFVALLRTAGYAASGLELSPSIVELAREMFDVPMLVGPIETHDIEKGSLQAIVLMDVIEHLPDPVATLRHCVDLLDPTGFIMVQTPRYPEGRGHAEMIATDDRFLAQLLPGEHLHLFSKQSVQRLLGVVGAEHVAFEPAPFAHYDMLLVASRCALEAHAPEAAEAALLTTAHGRLVLALLDSDARSIDAGRSIAAANAESLVDRQLAHKQEQEVERLHAENAQLELDRNAVLAERDSFEEQNRRLIERVNCLTAALEAPWPQQLERLARKLASEARDRWGRVRTRTKF